MLQIDETIVKAILLFFGFPLIGIIETVKRWLRLEGWSAIVLAIVLSFAATAIYLALNGLFTVVALIGYGIIVAMEASGFYKIIKV